MTTRRHCSAARIALVPIAGLLLLVTGRSFAADKLDIKTVEGQPLGENAKRLLDALDFLGAPLPKETADAIRTAAKDRDAAKLQELLDPHVLVQVTINPESRVKAARGPAAAKLAAEWLCARACSRSSTRHA